MEEGQLIQSYLEANKISHSEFARLLDVTRQNVHRYLVQKRLTEKFKKRVILSLDLPENFFENAFSGLAKINVISNQAMASPVVPTEEKGQVLYSFYSPGLVPGREYLAVKVQGTSMEPTIANGDLVVFEQHPIEQLVPDRVYLVRALGNIMVKRVRHAINAAEPSLELLSDNPTFPPQIIRQEEVDKIWLISKKIGDVR